MLYDFLDEFGAAGDLLLQVFVIRMSKVQVFDYVPGQLADAHGVFGFPCLVLFVDYSLRYQREFLHLLQELLAYLGHRGFF